jgi:hypothetical protein
VIVNQGLRYPRRNGTVTRYLSEPEVATAYRERLVGAQRQQLLGQRSRHVRARPGRELAAQLTQM